MALTDDLVFEHADPMSDDFDVGHVISKVSWKMFDILSER